MTKKHLKIINPNATHLSESTNVDPSMFLLVQVRVAEFIEKNFRTPPKTVAKGYMEWEIEFPKNTLEREVADLCLLSTLWWDKTIFYDREPLTKMHHENKV